MVLTILNISLIHLVLAKYIFSSVLFKLISLLMFIFFQFIININLIIFKIIYILIFKLLRFIVII